MKIRAWHMKHIIIFQTNVTRPFLVSAVDKTHCMHKVTLCIQTIYVWSVGAGHPPKRSTESTMKSQ